MLGLLPALMSIGPALPGHAQPSAGDSYTGMAEASAAVRLDDSHFVVAEDECNTLLVYAGGQPNPVGAPINLAAFLKTEDKASDIEGGALVGDTVYWISSHSLPKSGKPRDWRQRFFATKVSKSTSPPTLSPYGRAYAKLLNDLIDAGKLKALKLRQAAKILPEQDGGINIEGLAVWDHGGLLIGFRSPLIGGMRPSCHSRTLRRSCRAAARSSTSPSSWTLLDGVCAASTASAITI